MTATVKTSPSNDLGFTLVEMLMAMLVLTVGLLGLLQSVNLAYRHNLRDRLNREAVLVAEEQMHGWQKLSFGSISGGGTSNASKLVGGTPWSYTVSKEASPLGGGDTKRLSVSVTWKVRGENLRHEIYALRTRRAGE